MPFRFDSTGVLNFSDNTIDARRLISDYVNSMYLLSDYGAFNYELVKYDSAGIFQWSTNALPVAPGFGDIGFEMLIDYNNDLVLVGLSDTMLKFSSAGSLIWRKPMDRLDGYRISAEITGNNYIAVAGSRDSLSGYDMVVRFYNINGNPTWEGYYNGNVSGQEYTVDMAADNLGVYVVENNADTTVLAKFSSPFSSVIDFSMVCVDSVWYDPLDSTFINVRIFNGNSGLINYPSVQIVSPTGDTIGNPSNQVTFFGQGGNSYQVYHDTITVAGITDFSNYTFLMSEGFGDTTVVITWCNPLSVYELEEGEMSIFPNPSHDILYIQNRHGKSLHREIYNAIGKKVLEGKPSAEGLQAIDVSLLTEGIYFIRVQNEMKTSVIKFVKQ
jgi:hypothetical protein